MVLGVLIFAGNQNAQAENTPVDVKTADVVAAPVDVGNKICPVLGGVIDEKYKATYEYEGKIYNFCCSACIEEFKKDPKKYIQKIEEEQSAVKK
ncbi:MAG: YHS domain-containing protein [Candidatus Omnitrophica bacterium]|nr:YHS domain-containing protein [Candidatus Omnitrophota bacterium]